MSRFQHSFHRETDWPLISVIITTYNYAHFLPNALESVLSQEYPHLEILVLDDASTDSTPLVMAAYSADERIRSIRHAHNLGACENANYGLRMARGRYISLLSADNQLGAGFIATLAESLLADQTIDIAYGCNRSVNMNDGTLIPWQYLPAGFTGGVPMFANLLTAGCCICLESAVVKREVYEQYGVLSPALKAADLEILIRWAAAGLTFAHRPAALFITNVHQNQVSAPEKYLATGQLAADYFAILDYYLRPEYAAKIRGFEIGIGRTLQAVTSAIPQESAVLQKVLSLADAALILKHRLETLRRHNASLPRENGLSVVILDTGSEAALQISVRALVDQPYQHWEALIMRDSTALNASRLTGLDPLSRIKTVDSPAEMNEPARCNLALKMCAMNTCIFVHAGSLLLGDQLSRLMQLLQTSSIEGVIGLGKEPSERRPYEALVLRREAIDRCGPFDSARPEDYIEEILARMKGRVAITSWRAD